MSEEKKIINDEELENVSGGWYPFTGTKEELNAKITSLLTDAGNKAWLLGDPEHPGFDNDLWREINMAEKNENAPDREMMIHSALSTAKRMLKGSDSIVIADIVNILQEADSLARQLKHAELL